MFAPLTTTQRFVVAAAVVLTGIAGLGRATGLGDVAEFILSGLALAALAALVGQAIEQVGEHLGPGATGLLQSALGNLPELFVGIFALREGLTGVVRSALIGSVLSNVLLVLGAAFLVGGTRHGTQSFDPEGPRMIGTLLSLAVAALVVPTLASQIHTPAVRHAGTLSDICAAVLLLVYAASIPFWLRGGPVPASRPPAPASTPAGDHDGGKHRAGSAWPLPLAVLLLAAGSLGAAAVSDWFVAALRPATHSLGLSQTFTGLVVVAIASNAVENVVGIRFASKARPDYAISTILNSPLQVALLLTPVLVLLSSAVGPTQLTLVFPPLLVVALALATVVVVVVIYDGEYTWLEGIALIGLYVIISAVFWWG